MSRSDRLSTGFRVGFISSINPSKHTARVKFPDLGKNVVSHDLQILRRRSRGDREYWMYDEGEQVWCFFVGHGLEDGIILGATFNDEDEPPVTDPDKHRIAYRDDTWFEYDRARHIWTVHIEGEIDVYAKDNITVKTDAAASLDAEGNISISTRANVSVTAGGDIALKARNISMEANDSIKMKASRIDLN